jgi:hypothetical protein
MARNTPGINDVSIKTLPRIKIAKAAASDAGFFSSAFARIGRGQR